jgi:hypothetical protein
MLLIDVFAPKSCRVISYYLSHPKEQVSQRQVIEATNVAAGLVSRVTSELVASGIVKRTYRTRFSLEYPQKLMLDWIGNRHVAQKKAFFAKDASVLDGVEHVHTLFSGAFLDTGYLKTRFTTAYVSRDFQPKGKLLEGRVADFLGGIVVIPAEDEFVFYGKRKIGGEWVVNPALLFVDLASLGGMGSDQAIQVAAKRGWSDVTRFLGQNSTGF